MQLYQITKRTDCYVIKMLWYQDSKHSHYCVVKKGELRTIIFFRYLSYHLVEDLRSFLESVIHYKTVAIDMSNIDILVLSLLVFFPCRRYTACWPHSSSGKTALYLHCSCFLILISVIASAFSYRERPSS